MSKNLSRRDFLKGAAATAVSTAFLGLQASAEAATEGAAANYTPGTYTATAQGMESPVTVTMTFDETSITDVVIDVSGETEGIGAAAGEDLKTQILATQGVAIDGVSGATVTSKAVQDAVNDCITQAGGTVSVVVAEAPKADIATDGAAWPANEPADNYAPVAAGEGTIAYEEGEIDPAQVIDEQDIDVLVCGLGPAGLAATLSCAERGLKTVAVEKNATGLINSMTIGGITDRVHQHYGVEFDKKQMIDEAMNKNGYRGNQDLYKRIVEEQEEGVNWFFDQLPFATEDYKLTFFGYSGVEFPDFTDPYDVTSRDHSWNTSINLPFPSAQVQLQYLTERCQDAGAELHFETPVVQLIVDAEGNVVGAYAKSAEGYIKFNTAKGVVLATGGYEHNMEMLKRCCRPRDLQLISWLTYATNNTGDGHLMAEAVGAMEDEYPHPLMLDPMQLMSFVRVNSEGKRFVGEYETYDHLASAMQAQYGGYDFTITDANALEAVDKMWSPSTSAYGPKEVWAGSAQSPNALVADTLEELADLMGVPQDAFVETINHWNEMCDAGEDTDYGYPGERMHRIDTAPFYATKEMAESLATSGGLQVTDNWQVKNMQNQPIGGLFAIGNTSGSMFSNTYPHSMNCLSHTRCYVGGYYIGKYLSNDAPINAPEVKPLPVQEVATEAMTE